MVTTRGGASTRSLADRRRHEAGYIVQPNRDAQDTYLLYECIVNSLSPEAKTKTNIWRDDFWVNNLPLGNLLKKVVIREYYLDTKVNVMSIRQGLALLDMYLPTIDYNMGKMNMYIKTLLDQLAARGR